MKMWSLSLLLFAFLLTACSNQNIPASKVPSVVLNTLKEKHAAANDVEWEKKQNLYEAEVQLTDSTEATLQIDETGKLVMQKQDITIAEIPEAIKTTVQSSYAAYTLDDAERIEKNGVTYYQVELEDGNKEEKLVFTPDGKEETAMKLWD